jgi:predicted metal-dependent peptidase
VKQDSRIIRTLLAIRRDHPFFGALSLFAPIHFRPDIETACTDGKNIFLGSNFCDQIDDLTLAAVILHELLHCALEHTSRRGARDSYIWNVAADIVVNGIISDESEFTLPDGAIEDERLKSYSTEVVYQKIEQAIDQYPGNIMRDLIEPLYVGELDNQRKGELYKYWSAARISATAIAQQFQNNQGHIAGEQLRQLMEVSEPQIDWRSLLWQKLSRVPFDFDGYDHRFISQGRYSEVLSVTSTNIHVVVDTSGSIYDEALRAFLNEVIGIKSAYPSLNVLLYYCDTDLYGPYVIKNLGDIKPPMGSGGTSFEPIFQQLNNEPDDAICVYLTDGYGSFPLDPPEQETIWVVTADGANDSSFPFGEVIRMD